MTALFDEYPTGQPAWDEMLAAPDQPRSAYAGVYETLRRMTPEDLNDRVDTLSRHYVDTGVTFDYAGEERAFPLDLVPRIITADDWDVVDRGVKQRVTVLEMLLADIYSGGGLGHPPRRTGRCPAVAHHRLQRALPPLHRRPAYPQRRTYPRLRHRSDPRRDRHVPRAGGQRPRTVRRLLRHLEPSRHDDGVPRVVRGVRCTARGRLPEPAARHAPRRRPGRHPRPTGVVLTPGVFNSAYYEHTLLARTMGVEPVEGRDLICSGGVVRMRTTRGLQPVDVIYRRVDDEFLDPVQFRPDSMLGCPGLVSAMRSGRVTVANAVGNGVADDKLIYSYVPDLIRYYLDEDPILPNVDTYRCIEPTALRYVLNHVDEMVVKPVAGSGGKGLVVGTQATAAELDDVREAIVADPRNWIAQPVVQLSTIPTIPTFIDGKLRPRHVDLRPFAVNDGERVTVLPGGLTRVALPEGQLVVNSSRGGGSKDTWVLSDTRHNRPVTQERPREVIVLSPPAVFRDDEIRAQQQQQQQSGVDAG